MKKRTAAIFILFANIMILAHAVVPHHHLANRSLIVISSICEKHKGDPDSGHHHAGSTTEHEHNDTQNDDYCSLNQFVGIPKNQAENVQNDENKIRNHTLLILNIATLTNDYVVNKVFSNSIRIPSNYIYSFHTPGLKFTAGLRSPPTV